MSMLQTYNIHKWGASPHDGFFICAFNVLHILNNYKHAQNVDSIMEMQI